MSTRDQWLVVLGAMVLVWVLLSGIAWTWGYFVALGQDDARSAAARIAERAQAEEGMRRIEQKYGLVPLVR